MTVPLQEQFVAEVAMPLVGIVLPLPFVDGDGSKRLLDFHELPAPPATAAKITIVMHDDGANDGEDCLQNRTIPAALSAFAEYIEATPPTLDGLVDLDDLVTPPRKGVVFADGSDHLAVREIA
jgi:hypothetical protein